MLKLAAASPNEVGNDNETDESVDVDPYKYPDLEASEHPYWKAYSKDMKILLKEHDRLELYTLFKHNFKLREAWTATDEPFYED